MSATLAYLLHSRLKLNNASRPTLSRNQAPWPHATQQIPKIEDLERRRPTWKNVTARATLPPKMRRTSSTGSCAAHQGGPAVTTAEASCH